MSPVPLPARPAIRANGIVCHSPGPLLLCRRLEPLLGLPSRGVSRRSPRPAALLFTPEACARFNSLPRSEAHHAPLRQLPRLPRRYAPASPLLFRELPPRSRPHLRSDRGQP